MENNPGISDCAFWTITLIRATHAAAWFVALPLLIQDICPICHPTRRVPNCPRFNIYRGQNPSTIVPCVLEDWF